MRCNADSTCYTPKQTVEQRCRNDMARGGRDEESDHVGDSRCPGRHPPEQARRLSRQAALCDFHDAGQRHKACDGQYQGASCIPRAWLTAIRVRVQSPDRGASTYFWRSRASLIDCSISCFIGSPSRTCAHLFRSLLASSNLRKLRTRNNLRLRFVVRFLRLSYRALMSSVRFSPLLKRDNWIKIVAMWFDVIIPAAHLYVSLEE